MWEHPKLGAPVSDVGHSYVEVGLENNQYTAVRSKVALLSKQKIVHFNNQSVAKMPAQKLDNPEQYQKIFHWAETQQNGTVPSFPTRHNDPYKYMPGFGNSFESEAVPGTIPHGQNSPRAIRWGLYAEQLTASAFVAPRHSNKKAWLYRARPAVAHQGFVSGRGQNTD